MQNLLPTDGEAFYFKDFLSAEEANKLFERLLHDIRWRKDELRLFGKTYVTEREVAWYADPGLKYRYSGATKHPLDWHPALLELKRYIEARTHQTFNACLLNLYHHGDQGMGWHSDDEPELGDTPAIASVSLGAERKFAFKHKHKDLKQTIWLENGSLLMMQGATQKFWKHGLPKSKKVKEARINLTFRYIGLKA